ncbi:MAG: UDP-N-acetylmuramate--L-alanine ligase [Candidatus Andersenbacteria bacterium]
MKLQGTRVHFVGIGGMGISGLARLCMGEGAVISGTDRNRTRATEAFVTQGVPITIAEYAAHNLPRDAELVVYTKDEEQNPEVREAKRRRIPVKSYPEALPIALGERAIIGVSGTHGKTTTTGMIASILLQAKQDPSVVVGSFYGFLGSAGSNSRLGKGRFAVVEADEYKRAFLNYRPTIAVVTNVEADHLNYYKDLEDIHAAFTEFVGMVPDSGVLVACADDSGAKRVAATHNGHTILYGLTKDADVRGTVTTLKGPVTAFSATYQGKSLGSFSLRVPGEHNVRNALAAIAVAAYIGVPVAAIRKGLAEFPGAWRRFEYKGEVKGVTVIDDYAHHPTELEATLRAARDRFGKRRLIAVFQPHFYGRLRDFFTDFVQALQLADRVVVPPVYFVAGREADDPKLRDLYNSERLAEAVTKKGTTAVATPTLDEAVVAAVTGVRKGDVILTIGAGTVTELGPKILKALNVKS